MPLTARGWEQALEAGESLRKLLEGDGHTPKLYFYHSPYTRTKQVWRGVKPGSLHSWCGPAGSVLRASL